MSFTEYYLVRHSDLFEGQPTKKFLLSTVAMLICGPEDENGKPNPDAGYCFARQRYLAAEVGCSRGAAQRHIKGFVADGLLTKDDYRDEQGHQRCKYSFTPEQLAYIESRARKRDGKGREIRAISMPKKARERGAGNLGHAKPSDGVSPGGSTPQAHLAAA